MLLQDAQSMWSQFLEYTKKRCSPTAYENWLVPIRVLEEGGDELVLEVPNIFVQEYLLDNYGEDLRAFVPVRGSGEPAIKFIVREPEKKPSRQLSPAPALHIPPDGEGQGALHLNKLYRLENFIEGPANQFIKSAAMGVATRPGRSYNPLFMHGGVGLGKTHLLHGIGHYVREHSKKLRVQSITTEAFINDLVDSLRKKTVDKMKRFYRSLDVLLVDDIQFLQNRLNFEEEFCNTFEALINQNKQIVITSDKPPGQLKLSERMVARMEWGLVAKVGMPDLETRVAILQHKAEQRGLKIPNEVAFFLGERLCTNVRQLEGAVNRLSAHCRLLNEEITLNLVENTLRELLQQAPQEKVSIESIMKGVAAVFGVRVNDLKGSCRTKEIALARQVAMFLARDLVSDSLVSIGASFGGKTHSTILHACKNIEEKLADDEKLRLQVEMIKRNVATAA